MRRSADLKRGPDRWPAEERAALAFARQMTLDAGSVTDAEVAELRRTYGEEKLVAMVLLLAYSNFQDRLLLTLAFPWRKEGRCRPSRSTSPGTRHRHPVPPRARPGRPATGRPCRRCRRPRVDGARLRGPPERA